MPEEKIESTFSLLKAIGLDVKTWLVNAVKSRTMLFAALLTILGFVEANSGMFQGFLGDHYGLFTMVTGVIVALLRVITVEPLSAKTE